MPFNQISRPRIREMNAHTCIAFPAKDNATPAHTANMMPTIFCTNLLCDHK